MITGYTDLKLPVYWASIFGEGLTEVLKIILLQIIKLGKVMFNQWTY